MDINNKIKRHFKNLFRYTVSGITSVVAQFATLAMLVEIAGIDKTFSSGIAFMMGCAVNYLMLYKWAFASNGKHSTVLFRYSIVMAFTLLLNVTIFWILIGPIGLWYQFSQMIAVVFVAVFNLLLNKHYTFAEPELVKEKTHDIHNR